MRWLLLPAVALAACAQIRDPQGGPKDERAPRLLLAEPPNGSVRFDAQRILLRFDERVDLDRVRERLLISPPLEKAPDVSIAGGDAVVIALKAPLKPNTTYTFNVGEAVVDLTERNPAAGITYVVSTGDVLDSLAISGAVVDAFSGAPETNAIIAVHAVADTGDFTTSKPGWFGRTDKQGLFHVRNLPAGEYHVRALADQNGNYRYDLPNERVAFVDSTIAAGSDGLVHLRMFLPEAPVQVLLDARVEPDRSWRLALAKPATSIDLSSIDRTGGSLVWTTEWSTTRDTVLFWPNDTTLLDGQRFTMRDTSGVLDTIVYRPLKKMPFYVGIKALPGDTMFRTSRPVARWDAERVRLIARPGAEGRAVAITQDPLHRRQVRVAIPADTAQGRVIEWLPGAVHDIYGGTNDTVRIALSNARVNATGDLTIRLLPDSGSIPGGPYLLQAADGKERVLFSEPVITLPAAVERRGLPAGAYHLKLVEDKDGNGRWSTGSYRERQQPERVLRQAGEATVRGGWQVEVEWRVATGR